MRQINVKKFTEEIDSRIQSYTEYGIQYAKAKNLYMASSYNGTAQALREMKSILLNSLVEVDLAVDDRESPLTAEERMARVAHGVPLPD